MAVQAHMYPDNLGIMPVFGSQSGVGFVYNHPSPDFDNNFVFSGEIERQSQEIEEYINLQSERLKLVLQEQRKQQLSALIRKLDAKAMIMFRQKDEEIAAAKRRTFELEELMRRVEMENQSWKRLAGENEAMVINLNTSLQQQRQRMQQEPVCDGAVVEDAESCCHVSSGGEEVVVMGMECRGCGFRNSSVLILPCRHLCCCVSCDAFLDFCPVCESPKKGTIQALVS